MYIVVLLIALVAVLVWAGLKVYGQPKSPKGHIGPDGHYRFP